jgi:hypothetical protein
MGAWSNSMISASKNCDWLLIHGYPWILEFLVEDISREESVKKAAGICEWYEGKSVPGITYCIANTRIILAGTFDDLFELFNAHNGVFLAKNNKIYRLRIDDEHFYSLLVWFRFLMFQYSPIVQVARPNLNWFNSPIQNL